MKTITQKRVSSSGTIQQSKEDPNRQYTSTGHGFTYQKAQKVNEISLTKENLKQESSHNSKYQEQEKFLSKKIIQNFPKATSMEEMKKWSKYHNSMKEIDIVKADAGKMWYMLQKEDRFLEEKDLDANYIHVFENKVWDYYIHNNKVLNPKEDKK